MLIYSMSVSLDGFFTDRQGSLDWAVPDDELFRFHLEKTRALAGHFLGRRLYDAMSVWETDPALRSAEPQASFAVMWSELPKVVFSRSLDCVEGNSRLAERSVVDEIDATLAAADGDWAIGGADLAAQAIQNGLVDEFHVFRHPVILGGGTPLLPAVAEPVDLESLETRAFTSGVVLERYRRR